MRLIRQIHGRIGVTDRGIRIERNVRPVGAPALRQSWGQRKFARVGVCLARPCRAVAGVQNVGLQVRPRVDTGGKMDHPVQLFVFPAQLVADLRHGVGRAGVGGAAQGQQCRAGVLKHRCAIWKRRQGRVATVLRLGQIARDGGHIQIAQGRGQTGRQTFIRPCHVGLRQMKREVCLGTGGHPAAHRLRGMARAALLANPRIAPPGHRIAPLGGDGECRGWRRQIVVIGLSRPRPCRQIHLADLPDRQIAACEIGRCGEAHHQMRGFRHRAVVAMLTGHVEKGRADDVGPLGADDLDKARQRAVASPPGQGLVARLGEAEIENRIVRALR